MKRNKRFFIGVVMILSIFAAVPSMAAEYLYDVVVSMQIDNPVMQINGADSEIDEGRGTTPVIINGRTLVPIRAIIEAFGGSVEWNGTTKTVTLLQEDDVINLIIDGKTAYLNGLPRELDTAPTVINGRTMLPIRFVAEGFNLGVAWDADTKTVSVIRNSFDNEEYNYLMSVVPDYSGAAYVEINSNIPLFKDYEIISGSFEYYNELDELGRCDVAMASVAEDLMPTGERDDISAVIPSGWQNKKYDTVPGGYLYNRCHLIGYQLTGENANEKNLITGTRYLNIEGMLPFENMVDDYIEESGNHVMYRVTPVFSNDNLVADGVLLEGYSVEDNGAGISFCVYCYNVQPYIIIDYQTGANYETENVAENDTVSDAASEIYRTPTGKRYHYDADCGGVTSYALTLDAALAAGLTPCKKCAQ